VEWIGTGCNWQEWIETYSNCVEWIETHLNLVEWIEMDCNCVELIETVEWIETDWNWVEWIEMNWNCVELIETDWKRLWPECVGKVLELWVLVVDVGDGDIEGGGAPLLTLVLRFDRLHTVLQF